MLASFLGSWSAIFMYCGVVMCLHAVTRWQVSGALWHFTFQSVWVSIVNAKKPIVNRKVINEWDQVTRPKSHSKWQDEGWGRLTTWVSWSLLHGCLGSVSRSLSAVGRLEKTLMSRISKGSPKISCPPPRSVTSCLLIFVENNFLFFRNKKKSCINLQIQDPNDSTAGRVFPCTQVTQVWALAPHIVPQSPPAVIPEHRTRS